MHMSTGELKTHKRDTISLLEIVSMEGRYYMARFYLDGQGYVLTDTKDNPVMFTGASAAREHFTGTDEMIGMPDTGSETMKVPL